MATSDTLPSLTAPQKVRGFDVSEYCAGKVDFAAMEAAGYSFVILRASAGLRPDHEFLNFMKAVRKTTLCVGPYHGFMDNLDPESQAKNYFSIAAGEGLVSPYEEFGALPPMNDFELIHGPSHVDAVQKAYDFQRSIEEKWNISQNESFVYTYPYFAQTLPRTDALAGLGLRRLAIAHYGVNSPTVPYPWTRWDIWQHAGDVTVQGTYCDLDLYNGLEIPILGKDG